MAGEYIKKIMRFSNTPYIPRTAITFDDICEVKNRLRVGDHLKCKLYESYLSNAPQKISGEVLGIYPNFVLLQIGKHRECILWVDLILNKYKTGKEAKAYV